MHITYLAVINDLVVDGEDVLVARIAEDEHGDDLEDAERRHKRLQVGPALRGDLGRERLLNGPGQGKGERDVWSSAGIRDHLCGLSPRKAIRFQREEGAGGRGGRGRL